MIRIGTPPLTLPVALLQTAAERASPRHGRSVAPDAKAMSGASANEIQWRTPMKD